MVAYQLGDSTNLKQRTLGMGPLDMILYAKSQGIIRSRITYVENIREYETG